MIQVQLQIWAPVVAALALLAGLLGYASRVRRRARPPRP